MKTNISIGILAALTLGLHASPEDANTNSKPNRVTAVLSAAPPASAAQVEQPLAGQPVGLPTMPAQAPTVRTPSAPTTGIAADPASSTTPLDPLGIPDPVPSPGTNPEAPATLRDPFANTPAIIQDAQGVGNGPVFYPGLANENTPVMRLRGQARLIGSTNAVALLELEGMGVFTVQEGDTVSLQGRGRLSVVKVQKITKQSLFVEFGSMGQVMVVR